MKKKILYVEDDLKIADSFCLFFRLFHDTYHTNNGKEALEKFYEIKDFDMIITDISMPIMGGIEMIKEIRQTHENLPIYIISAFDETEVIDEAFELGVLRYIEKPINLKDIMQFLEKDLDNKSI